MKYKDCKIEIPGCTDILFFADIKFKGDTDFPWKGYPIAHKIGDEYCIPSSGKMIIKYYSSDDLSWIKDWMEYVYNNSCYTESNVSKLYARRRIKMYNENYMFTFCDAYPCKIEYDDSDYSTENILSGSSTITVTFVYDWAEKLFI